MPDKSFTVEFWARGASMDASGSQDQYSEFFSYATRSAEAPQDDGSPLFMDDAIRIHRYWAYPPVGDFGFQASCTNDACSALM